MQCPFHKGSTLCISWHFMAFHGISWHFMAFHGCDLAKTRLLLLEYMMFHDCLYAPWSAISLSYLFASLEMYLLRASWVASTASSEFGKCEGTFLHVSSIKYASTETIIEVFETCPILFFIHLQCFHLQLERVVSDILSLHDQTYGNRCSAVSVHISKLWHNYQKNQNQLTVDACDSLLHSVRRRRVWKILVEKDEKVLQSILKRFSVSQL